MKFCTHLIIFTAVLFVKSNLLAQNVIIRGNITDSSNRPITSATILLKRNNGNILFYKFSDKNGNYTFNIDSISKIENSKIEVSSVGFFNQSKIIESNIFNYNFKLNTKYNDLENVVVKSRNPIRSKGDTLKYDVKSFSAIEDKSIGDVINRIPGMTVAEDGTIYFNGKKINNLVIQNDDLMGGKYGLATKTISKENIKSIEVIQHYQPISILKNKVFTDDIAVNLVLKNDKEVKGSGQGIIGVGQPTMFTATANSILLNAKIKMLNTIKYNNIGEDYKYENIDLTSSEIEYPKYILSDAAKDNAPIPLKYYYRNNSFKISLNNLVNLNDSSQIRINFNYYKDQNDINYNSHTENIIQNDTLVYNELHYFRKKPFNYSTSINILKNKNRYYFNNNLQINSESSNSAGNSIFNRNVFSQNVTAQINDIHNKLVCIPNLFKHDVIAVNLDFNFLNNPQFLVIDTGISKQLFNLNQDYKKFTQNLELPTFRYKVLVNYYVNNFKVIQQSYQFGIDNKHQLLNSNISLLQINNISNSYQGDAGNNVRFDDNKIYLNPIYYMKNDKWRINFTSPIVFQKINDVQNTYGIRTNKSYIYINPEIKGENYLTGEKSLIFSYKRNNKIGNILNLYNGLIATNYLQFTKNSDVIQEAKVDNLLFQYKVNNNLKMFFYTLGAEYKFSSFNSINSNEYRDFIQKIVSIPVENHQKTYSILLNLSKYIFPIKTKLSWNITLSNTQMTQIINNELIPYKTTSGFFNYNIICNPIDQLSLKYDGTVNVINNKSISNLMNALNLNNNINIINHTFSIKLSPSKTRIHMTFDGYFQNYISSYANGYHTFISDIKVKYIFQKPKIEFEFNCDNIFNIKNFHYFNSNMNQLYEFNYNLRGRQFVLKTIFNF